MKELKAVQVELDESGPYQAYAKPGELWNGFAVPAFTEEVALQVLEDVKSWTWYLDPEIDSFLIRHEGDDLGDPPYKCQGFSAWTSDGPQHLYPIGAYFWSWRLVKEAINDRS
jgi:hypothetical protein